MDRSIRNDAPGFGEAMADGPCTDPALQKALPRWDRLESAERARLEGHAAACPYCGPALALLRQADDWLVAQTPLRPTTPCPAADDLYEFGAGPGAHPMPPHQRAEIEEHLDQCVECETLVATLASKPPSPVIVEEPEEAAAPLEYLSIGEPQRTPRRRPRALRRLRTLAAAAAVLATSFFVWSEIQAAGSNGWTAVRYPALDMMRGEDSGRLLHPRGLVLPLEDGARFGSGLVFELSSQVRGSSYRIQVDRHDGGAFDTGTPVFELSAGTPLLRPSPEQLALLTAGDYTWEAWAQIDGLDVHLGRRDFHVEECDGLDDQLKALENLSRFEHSTARLQLLWDGGYHADARALARSFPESEERDRFLDRVPGQ